MVVIKNELPHAMLNRDFKFFIVGSTLNGLALGCMRIGLAWYALQSTGSAAIFAGMIAASTIVEIYSKPVLSPLADIFDRLKLLRVCYGLGFCLCAALWLAVASWPFSVPWITGLLVVLSAVAGLREPCAAGLVPSLVLPQALARAQSIRATVASVVGLGGTMIGGLLLSVANEKTALVASTALAAAALVCQVLVRHPGSSATAATPATPAAARPALTIRSWFSKTIDGVRAVWQTKSERYVALASGLINVGIFPLTAIVLPVWVMRNLGGSPAIIATVEASLLLGAMAGSSFVTARLSRWIGQFGALRIACALMGISTILAAAAGSWITVVPLMFLCGVGFSVYAVITSTLRAAATPAHFRARMAGGVGFLSCAIYPFTSGLFGYVSDGFGAPTAVAICGVMMAAAGIVLSFNRDAKSLLARPTEDISGAYGTLYPAAFGEGPAQPVKTNREEMRRAA